MADRKLLTLVRHSWNPGRLALLDGGARRVRAQRHAYLSDQHQVAEDGQPPRQMWAVESQTTAPSASRDSARLAATRSTKLPTPPAVRPTLSLAKMRSEKICAEGRRAESREDAQDAEARADTINGFLDGKAENQKALARKALSEAVQVQRRKSDVCARAH